MMKSFYEWLHQPQPDWKINLDNCDSKVFSELKMERRQVEEILEVLHEFGVFEKVATDD